MSYHWPVDTTFTTVILDVDDTSCPDCSRRMHICDHRTHKIHSFRGPLQLINRLVQCNDPQCPSHRRTFSAQAEYTITMPWWVVDWEVFAWIGHRRFARHWSVAQLRAELSDSYQIALSDDAIENSIRRYQTMLAAREQDPELLAEAYLEVEDLILSIDGLQPEKGHETLYVVRELRRKRVWFAESLLSSSAAEVRRLIAKAREWAERLGIPVCLWISDKQDAFLTGIADEFPGVPHRYCDNHFLRDLAKPVMEEDSHAKVKMRKKVRGLRGIERSVLEDRQAADAEAKAPKPDDAAGADPEPATVETKGADADEVVLDYCSAVRGILNNDQGGPLHPPGLRMADDLREVRASLQRNLDAKKGALPKSASGGSRAVSTAVLSKSKTNKRKSSATSKRCAR